MENDHQDSAKEKDIAREGAGPTVSIITPTYNRAAFITETVQSVLEQTCDDWEMWIIDDGSTDGTRERLAPFLQDSRIHYVYQDNQGQSVARNRALTRARGAFICFLDSDDSWLPDKLEQQLRVFREKPEVDIVYGDYIFIDGDGEQIHQDNMKRHSGYIAAQMLRDNCVSMNTTMARRRCFEEMGGMSARRRVADDYDLWLRFSARYYFYYLPIRLACYRIMENQLSSDKRSRFQANEITLKNFLATYPDAVSKTDVRAGLSVFYTRKARYHASIGERLRAFTSISRALFLGPTSLIVWRGVAKVLFPNLTRAHLSRLFRRHAPLPGD